MALGDKNKIEPDFWLNVAAETIYNSLEVRRAAVERLQKTIVWIFGVYSAIGIGSIMFAGKDDWKASTLFIFGVAFFFLVIAYWVSTTAAFPSAQQFYGNAPASIQSAHTTATRKSRKAFTAAIILCSIGVLLYSIALAYQFGGPAVFQFRNNRSPAPEGLIKGNIKKISNTSFALEVCSLKDTWMNLAMYSDTTVNDSIQTDEVDFTIASLTQKACWLRTDSTGKWVGSFSYHPVKKHVYYLWASYTDTLENGASLKTYKKRISLSGL